MSENDEHGKIENDEAFGDEEEFNDDCCHDSQVQDGLW